MCEQSFSCVQKEDEDIKDHFDGFENQVEVTENDGGELGTEMELSQQDESFSELSQSEQELEANVKADKARTREKFLAHGSLAGCDKKRFGNLTEDPENNFTFGNNECPETMQKVHEHSMNHEK